MKRWGWWVAAAVVVGGLIAGGVWGLQRADAFERLARAGKADAKAALRSLEAEQVPAALASFLKAKEEFGQARALLGPDWVRGLPWLGHQVSAADTLATIGLEGSSAGAEMAQLLASADAATGEDRVNQLLKLSRPHLDSALVSLTAVSRLSEGLRTDGLVPQLAGAVTELREQLKPLAPTLKRSQSLLDLERYLFGAQHRLLVVSQNNAELRPTGGFIGTYGLVEFGPDGFTLTRFTDIYTLPRDTLDLPLPIRGPVGYSHFSFQDSNWWIDFPTSATVMNQFWTNLKQPKIDGIVAIDIPTIRDLLKIFGPITVPQSKVPLTADNVLEQLTYLVEFDNGGAPDKSVRKKAALISLAAKLLRDITHLSNDQFLPTLAALANSTNEKHVQLHFNDPTAQAAILDLDWGGAIAPPAGTTDLLAVSNGMIKASKANIGVTKSLEYTVSLKEDGSADTTAVLGYKKSSLLLLGVPRQWMGNYVRVHRGEGVTAAREGSTRFETLDDDATGLPTFGHYFRLEPSSKASLVLHSTVPQALRPADGDSSHYQLLVVKQADLVDTAATVTVTVPAGWKVSGSTASFRVSGKAVRTTASPGSVSVKTPLKQDLMLDITLVKA